MWFKSNKNASTGKTLSMCDLDVWDMTADEKEAYCQKKLGKSYDQFIDDAFFDFTPEEREQVKRDWEYPKPKPE